MTTRSRTGNAANIVMHTPPRKRPATEVLEGSPAAKRTTTISQYFAAAKSPRKQTAVPKSTKLIVPPIQTSDTTKEVKEIEESVELEEKKEAAVVAAAEQQIEKSAAELKKSLDARAEALLTRLRNRPAVTKPEPAGARLEETRAIQEELRTRRAPTCPASPPPAASIFETVPDDKTAQVKSLARGFVHMPLRNLRLSSELAKLDSLFQSLEHAVLFQQSQSVVYHRVRKAVETMARRTFGWRELGQILSVFPEAYTYEPTEIVHNGCRVMSVVLTPNVNGMAQAVEMENRRSEFHSRLAARVVEAHRLFLIQRGVAGEIAAKAKSLHREFDVETVPAVVPVVLPPQKQLECQNPGALATFNKDRLKHLLASAKPQSSVPAINAKVPPPATLSLPTTAPSPEEKKKASVSASEPAAATNPQKSEEKPTVRAQSLLERIRAKQKAKDQALATSRVVPLHTRAMHGRLPGLVESLSFLFYAERRSVMPFYFVAEKLAEAKGLDKADLAKHLVSLCRFLPAWCSVL
ncbi:hypothetical protein FBU59_005089, partial [Linderina macrospora]